MHPERTDDTAGLGALTHAVLAASPTAIVVADADDRIVAVSGAFEALLARERELLTDLSVRDRKQLADLLRDAMTPFS